MEQALVLVTGGTGFIAQHCILALLAQGFRVRTTVRTLAREAEVREHLRTGGAEPGERLGFVVADLGADAGWAEAAKGCTYVIHGASPTPSGSYATDEDWVRPAVDGNLRVLRAARDAGVKRVVSTAPPFQGKPTLLSSPPWTWLVPTRFWCSAVCRPWWPWPW